MDNLYFFGRFNFPHYGYLYVIRESIEQLHPTNGITIIPSVEQATWGKHALSLTHRVAMLTLAIQELPAKLRSSVHISSIEYDVQKKLGNAFHGYTIDTLTALQARDTGPSAIVMGADAAIGIPGLHAGFTGWKNWQEIMKRAQLVVIPRGRYETAELVRQNLPKNLNATVLPTHPTEIELHASSTAIQQGNENFLPHSVRDYARKHDLLIQY